MSIARQFDDDAVATATFGSGGAEPYARALRSTNSNLLFMHETRLGRFPRLATMDVARWNADADETDLTLLASVTGPVLDIGCGPGRMVRAATQLGLVALGIDVSPTAVDVARSLGASALQRSVFDPLPGEGRWQTALLVDGNVGIGGNVRSLLARCAELVAVDGEVIVEVHPDPDRDRTYTARIVDSHGAESESFPWAEIGTHRLEGIAGDLGLELIQAWELDTRGFCRLAKTR